jgi:hypothetical protein
MADLITIASLGKLANTQDELAAHHVWGTLTPWLALDSRVAFEVPSVVACLAVALWCLGGAETSDRRLGFGLAELALVSPSCPRRPPARAGPPAVAALVWRAG